jgi:hypothetical protein
MSKHSGATELLRSDKHYLGGDMRLIWAPTHPVWLGQPGFWDAAQYLDLTTGPVFTISILDPMGNEIRLRPGERQWRPDRIQQTYAAPLFSGLEVKSLEPPDTLLSKLTLTNTTGCDVVVHAVLWTCQDTDPEGDRRVEVVAAGTESVEFVVQTRRPGRPWFGFRVSLAFHDGADSFEVDHSQPTANHPFWHLTPFYDSFASRLADVNRVGRGVAEGLVYLALHRKIVLPAGRDVTLVSKASFRPVNRAEPPRLNQEAARPRPRSANSEWQDFFGRVPSFQCSDLFLQKYYWYRWYGLRLNMLPAGRDHYRWPTVCEGIGYFRMPISYSAPCHIRETRWLPDPELARGCLRTFLAHQRPDGSFPGNIYVNGVSPESFYHADWGGALQALDDMHPDDNFLREAYEGLARYADYFVHERDPEGSGLFDVWNHYETGQEFMHRYQVVEPEADRRHWGRVFRLKGVDATVYVYQLFQALETIAERTQREDDVRKWRQAAERTRNAVRELMWDPDEEMFFDVDPRTMQRTGVKAAVCFYPYFTDLVDSTHLPGLKQHLFNPKEFWTAFPVPASSVDDRFFDASAHWRGKRHNCPWNGRVWPMTNSHIAEAIAVTAVRFDDEELRQRLVEFIGKYIRMMFFDGDLERPNCFEHYNPFTGRASVYRGVDDYQHSWVVDLLLKYVAGIRPQHDRLVIDPFPFGVKTSVSGCYVHGEPLLMEIDGDRFEVQWRGQTHRGTAGRAVELPAS